MSKLKMYITKIAEGHYDGKLATSLDATPVLSKTGFTSDFAARQDLGHELYKIQYPYHQLSFYELSLQVDNEDARKALKDKLADLEMELLFEKVEKQGMSEKRAQKDINVLIGKNWTERVEKAKLHSLDALVDVQKEIVIQRLADIQQHIVEINHNASPGALSIIELIRKIPGSKIATISLMDRAQGFDITKSGEVGYTKEHFNTFCYLLDRGIKEKAVVMIRQFIPGSEELTTVASGKKMMIPWKAIYGFGISPEGFAPFSAEDVEYSYTHDGADNPILPEDKVIYKDIRDFMK